MNNNQIVWILIGILVIILLINIISTVEGMDNITTTTQAIDTIPVTTTIIQPVTSVSEPIPVATQLLQPLTQPVTTVSEPIQVATQLLQPVTSVSEPIQIATPIMQPITSVSEPIKVTTGTVNGTTTISESIPTTMNMVLSQPQINTKEPTDATDVIITKDTDDILTLVAKKSILANMKSLCDEGKISNKRLCNKVGSTHNSISVFNLSDINSGIEYRSNSMIRDLCSANLITEKEVCIPTIEKAQQMREDAIQNNPARLRLYQKIDKIFK
jgi:hypothetical protein